jgi:hypothetical protein
MNLEAGTGLYFCFFIGCLDALVDLRSCFTSLRREGGPKAGVQPASWHPG